MNDEDLPALEKMVSLLEEILTWTKVTSIPHAKRVLEEELTSDEQKRAYDHSFDRTSTEVAELSGAGRSTVSNWWKKWHRAGLGKLHRVRGGTRFVRSFDLNDFNIPIPPLVGETRQQEANEDDSPRNSETTSNTRHP